MDQGAAWGRGRSARDARRIIAAVPGFNREIFKEATVFFARESLGQRGDREFLSSTAKRELTHHESYATREEARRSLFEYVKVFSNRQRLRSTLCYRSPAEYEVRFAS